MGDLTSNYDLFILDSIKMFFVCFLISLRKSKAKGDLLFTHHNGLHSAANYVLDFHIIDASIGWNVAAQLATYKRGLRADLVVEFTTMKL